jgi:protein-disulfide isomerase
VQEDPRIEAWREHADVSKVLTAGSPPVLGTRQGTITIVEFSDFQCPYCKRMSETIKVIMNEEGSAAKISLVYKNYPLPMTQDPGG